METLNGSITLQFNNGKTVQVSKEFWKKNSLDKYDVVRATMTGNLILFYGDYLSADQKSKIPKEKEKTEFDVVVTSYGSQKLKVVREVKSMTDLGLKESMEFISSLPKAIKKDVSRDEAEKFKALLEDQGATVEIK